MIESVWMTYRFDSMQSTLQQLVQAFQAAQAPSPKLQSSVSSQIVTEEGTSTFPPPTAKVTRPMSPRPEMGTSSSWGVWYLRPRGTDGIGCFLPNHSPDVWLNRHSNSFRAGFLRWLTI